MDGDHKYYERNSLGFKLARSALASGIGFGAGAFGSVIYPQGSIDIVSREHQTIFDMGRAKDEKRTDPGIVGDIACAVGYLCGYGIILQPVFNEPANLQSYRTLGVAALNAAIWAGYKRLARHRKSKKDSLEKKAQ